MRVIVQLRLDDVNECKVQIITRYTRTMRVNKNFVAMPTASTPLHAKYVDWQYCSFMKYLPAKFGVHQCYGFEVQPKNIAIMFYEYTHYT